AAGKAIVSTSIGAEGIPVVNDHNILIADEPEAFANHIIKLFNKPELIYQLSLNAASLAKEKLLNSNIILNLENFYKNLIASPNNIS
ncbi:MAG: glycosyltransferase family 4 protein, partial [Bacteroidales bacterium]|nr:glycosyltransferase family 4 protein [Bacteroidales bacterium]